MCLIIFSYKQHPYYRLIVASNRDEFYERPTQSLEFWKENPHILAGRDLKNKGAWIGVSKTGKIAFITNFRDSSPQKGNAPSRGRLVSDFLENKEPSVMYLDQLAASDDVYNPFNLVVGDFSDLLYYSNRGGGIQKLGPGLFGLSNHFMDTPWPKVETGKRNIQNLLSAGDFEVEEIFNILNDRSCSPDSMLPDTGIGIEGERMLSPLFVTSDIYGTRTSSVILIENNGNTGFYERTYVRDQNGSYFHSTKKKIFNLYAI